MGFDHIRKYVPYHAPLTSIFCAQEYNIGEIAVDLLLERITNRYAKAGQGASGENL